MHDSGTNAMTEVALGLSMAFFSILILALMSMGAHSSAVSENSENAKAFKHLSLHALDPSPAKSSEAAQNMGAHKQQLYFYVDGKVFDDKGEAVLQDRLAEIAKNTDIVIAVKGSLALQDALDVQAEFDGLPVKLTTMSQEWYTFLTREI
ncbi:hypothetical protein [Agaribacter flavus]|uniref:Uncharacterized protein n=1 Tax=Agaribacter flavus TaxID=1902781 RepID=A0ABV7FNQ7_9ALTE